MSSLTLLFSLMVLTYLFMQVDHGSLPAASKVLSKELDLSQAKFGLLGSLVYLGNALGSLASPYLFSKLNPKWIVVGSIFLNGVSLLLFALVPIFSVMCLSRVIVGIF